jgi:nucleoside-diphosphate-sugar epimerase
MKILVLGGAGYIGSALIPKLLTRSHDVTAMDLFWFGDTLPKGITKLPCDASMLQVEDLKGYDALVFLSGLSNDPMADEDPFANYVANAATPAYLAYIARLAGVKVFTHAGSCSVYGKSDEVMTEDSRPLTSTPYGSSKYMAETGIMQQAKDGLRIACLRMGTVCGPSPRMRFDLILNSMTKDAILEGTVKVFDDQAERPILDIEDACDAHILALENPDFHGVVNLVSYNISVYKAGLRVQELAQNLTKKTIKLSLLGGTDIRSYRALANRAEAFGFKSKCSLESTIHNILNKTDWTVDLKDPIFYNIERMRQIMAMSQTAGSHTADAA